MNKEPEHNWIPTNDPNAWVDANHIAQNKYDELNAYKEEMQKLWPVVELMKMRADPNSLVGRERDQKLAALGYSDEEIAFMTRFQEPTEEERALATIEHCDEQRRLLQKENRILKKQQTLLNRARGLVADRQSEYP